MMIDGGISKPKVPAPANVPMTMSSGYPRRLSSGSVILPIVAHVAADEPETAAKIAQPMTFVCSKRPGNLFNQGAKPLNKSCERRVRKRISPIHKKRGNAVSVQLEDAPQIVMAIASPAGLVENNSIPIQAVPANVRPTHTPPAKKPKSETINNVTIKISFMALLLLRIHAGFMATYAADE